MLPLVFELVIESSIELSGYPSSMVIGSGEVRVSGADGAAGAAAMASRRVVSS